MFHWTLLGWWDLNMTESEGVLKQVSIIKLNLRQEVVEAISLLSLKNLLRSNEEKTTVSQKKQGAKSHCFMTTRIWDLCNFYLYFIHAFMSHQNLSCHETEWNQRYRAYKVQLYLLYCEKMLRVHPSITSTVNSRSLLTNWCLIFFFHLWKVCNKGTPNNVSCVVAHVAYVWNPQVPNWALSPMVISHVVIIQKRFYLFSFSLSALYFGSVML